MPWRPRYRSRHLQEEQDPVARRGGSGRMGATEGNLEDTQVPASSFPAAPDRMPDGGAPCACGGTCPRCEAGGQPTPGTAGRTTPDVPVALGPVGHPAEARADALAETALDRGVPTHHPPAPVAREARAEPGASPVAGAGPASDAGPAPDGMPALPAPATVSRALEEPGRALPEDARKEMEDRFGRGFGDVRVHTGEEAADSARAVSAKAYAVGRDVVFSRGRFAPETEAGRELLAHELAHVALEEEGEIPPGVLRREPEEGTAVAEPPPRPLVEEGEAEEAAEREPAAEGAPGEGDAEPEEPVPPPREETLELDYAFVFTGGSYGRAARAYIRAYQPQHRLIEAGSFEEMFDRLHADLRRVPRGRRAHVRELIVVTHANAAGGIRIPLTRGDARRRRFFNVWDLADLQQEFRDGAHARFRARRREVVARLFDAETRVVVRGCEFGQSETGMEALRAFFGGQAWIWAPRGFQGYETLPIGGSMLRTPEQAFDFLIEQGYLPPELQPLPDEDKRAYIARTFGLHGAIPAEFLVMGREAYDRLRADIAAGRGTQAVAEPHKSREASRVPSLGEHWNLAAPSSLGEDTELDLLPLEEIEARARALMNPYSPRNASMLRRLSRAWERKTLGDFSRIDTSDPLSGLPPQEIFGDPNIIAMDAARFPGPPAPTRDLFEDETLVAPPREGRAGIDQYEEPPAADEGTFRDPNAPRPAPGPAPRAEAEADEGADAYARARDFDKDAPPLPPLPDLQGLSDDELAQEYRLALEREDRRRQVAIETEIHNRIEDPARGWGTWLRYAPDLPYHPANAGVSPDIALRILENVARGEAPFRPETGRVGGVSWFITEGEPYVGRSDGPRVRVDVEIAETPGRLVFREPELLEIFEAEKARLRPTLEAEFRQQSGIPPERPLSRGMRRNLDRLLERAAERRMWNEVGTRVRASQGGVGEVILEGSRFSRNANGRFGVVAQQAASRVRLRGGTAALVEALARHGVHPDPALTPAVEEIARRQRWSGRVRGAFRWGGRILIVVAVAHDAYRIYTAEDRSRAVVSTAGGWAGAIAGAGVFSAFWTPADTAGPVAWAIHGIGTLIAGGIGYFVGSETTAYIYDIVVDQEPAREE